MEQSFKSFFNEHINSTITLKQLYHHGYPDDDEIFWEFVTPSDLNKSIPIKITTPNQLLIYFKHQYRINTKQELLKLLSKEQKQIVKHYQQDNNLPNEIIVICNSTIIDGNHRALAALINNSNIRSINLEDIIK